MASKDPTEQIWTLMGEIGTAMVVTHSGSGEALRARPMLARPEIDDNAIYFLTDSDAPKDREIAHNSQVCLAFSDPKNSRYVSVTGVAEVMADTGLAEKVWDPVDKAFWGDAQDARIRVIRVTPDRGEFWDGDGLIKTFVSMLTASARGARPKLGESEKVDM